MQKFTGLVAALVFGAALFATAGCANTDAKPSQNAGVSKPAKTQAQPQPAGDADANQAYFTQVANDYVASGQPYAGKAIVDAFAAAGFDKTLMQVSFDKTPYNKDVDALFLSVRIDTDCLIAQFVQAGRTVRVSKAPAVGAERNVCLVGKTRQIDW